MIIMLRPFCVDGLNTSAHPHHLHCHSPSTIHSLYPISPPSPSPPPLSLPPSSPPPRCPFSHRHGPLYVISTISPPPSLLQRYCPLYHISATAIVSSRSSQSSRPPPSPTPLPISIYFPPSPTSCLISTDTVPSPPAPPTLPISTISIYFPPYPPPLSTLPHHLHRHGHVAPISSVNESYPTSPLPRSPLQRQCPPSPRHYPHSTTTTYIHFPPTPPPLPHLRNIHRHGLVAFIYTVMCLTMISTTSPPSPIYVLSPISIAVVISLPSPLTMCSLRNQIVVGPQTYTVTIHERVIEPTARGLTFFGFHYSD